ncbi:unnamed protein product [Effrenium voratum]|uniref:Opioid growth factor receptor (OGFr) conserved domain-containing protein n=1 Tax=Effrenium voratum TaxID=2562239 RepID=A0AA36NHQ0_9DINO|nr:unnamed protein product [Effrenium voratum]
MSSPRHVAREDNSPGGSSIVFADLDEEVPPVLGEQTTLQPSVHSEAREERMRVTSCSEDMGTASRFSTISHCNTDPELQQMGRAMTIKVALCASITIGEEDSEAEDDKEVRLPGRPASGMNSPDISPCSALRSPVSPSKHSEGGSSGFHMPAMKSVRSLGSRRSVGSRRQPGRSCGDLPAMTPRHTAKSAKNFRRGRKRVMVAGMNAKRSDKAPAERPSAETLLAFLRGVGPGPEGNELETILQWSLEKWENQHNYIQWLFPTDEESEYHPEAPVLTPEVQEEMLIDPNVEDNVLRAFEKFLVFLGLEYVFDEDLPASSTLEVVAPDEVRRASLKVCKGQAFRSRKKDCWVVNCPEGNHNWFRISRVLVSLRLLGFLEEAEAFYCCLEQLWGEGDMPGFAVHSMRIWRESAGEKRLLPKRRKKPRGPCAACVVS